MLTIPSVLLSDINYVDMVEPGQQGDTLPIM